MSFKPKILPRAQDDAQSIFNYLNERSPQGAAGWWIAFESAAEDAALGVVEYPLAPENAYSAFELRQVVFKTLAGRRYRFVFTVVDDELRILRVRGPGQPNLKPDEIGDAHP
jgi:plasmid stabilization system protein ParE